MAHGAAALAKTLNSAAAKLAQLAAKAAQLAAEAFKAAQAKLKEAESWQEKADSEFKLAAQDAGKALHTWPWDVPGDLYDAAKAELLYPALPVLPKVTVCTRVAPTAIPARATAAVTKVLDFMTRIMRGPGSHRHQGGQVCR